jgi:hypothetical protein
VVRCRSARQDGFPGPESVARRYPWQRQGLGGAGETLQFRDANEQLHCVNFIHADPIVVVTETVKRNIAYLLLNEQLISYNTITTQPERGLLMTQRIALVTGGSRGLGKNAALKLAAKGTDIILTYHSNRRRPSTWWRK